MTELRGTVNTEYELKFVTDEAGLELTRAWGHDRRLCDEGLVWFDRSHLFYDSDAFDLLAVGWAFRKKTDAFSYCLKYPIANEAMLLVRREVFIRKLPFALDFGNVMHRRTPVMARVVELMRSRHGDAAADMLRSIRPRVRIDCLREYFFSVKPATADRSVGMALDRVTAISVEDGAVLGEWCEVELETGWGFSEGTGDMLGLASELTDRGLRATAETKYELACRGAGLAGAPETVR